MVNAIVSNTGASYGINEGNATNAFYIGTYNDIYVPGGANSYIGLKGASTLCPTLASWRTATGQGFYSNSAAVTFANVATGDLHLAGASVGDDANLGAPPLQQLQPTLTVQQEAQQRHTKAQMKQLLRLLRCSKPYNEFQEAIPGKILLMLNSNSIAPYKLLGVARGIAGQEHQTLQFHQRRETESLLLCSQTQKLN
ncbi:MAG: hypothetical protein IPG99_07530 [Ignavibacteria bacterium]|nr:hypothetical protein [Ignavibacteria bacterium]